MSTYRDEFIATQKMLESKGHVVINPSTLPVGLGDDKYMPICMAMIDASDAIFMFNNWQNSKGARLEKAYAEYQGKEVLLCV